MVVPIPMINQKRKRTKTNFTRKKMVSPNRLVFHSMIKSQKFSCNELIATIKYHESSLSARDEEGYYPLYHSCQQMGYEKLSLKLLDLYPKAMNARSQFVSACNPLHSACFLGNYDKIVSLISTYPWLLNASDKYGQKPYFYACKNDQAKILQYFIDTSNIHINDVNIEGTNLLHTACDSLSFNCIDIFLSMDGFNSLAVDRRGYAPFHYLIKKVSLHICFKRDPRFQTAVKIIQKYCAMMPHGVNHVNNLGRNILHQALLEGWFPNNVWLEYIVNELKLDVNHQDSLGNTPIHIVVGNDNCSQIRIFNCFSANFNAKDNRGQTAFHKACSLHQYDMIKELFGINSVSITEKDVDGNTAFHRLFDQSPIFFAFLPCY